MTLSGHSVTVVFGCLHCVPWRLCYACDNFVFPQRNFLLLCEPFSNLFSPFVSFFHHFCLSLLFVVILCHYSFFRMLSILVIILHDFSFVFVFVYNCLFCCFVHFFLTFFVIILFFFSIFFVLSVSRYDEFRVIFVLIFNIFVTRTLHFFCCFFICLVNPETLSFCGYFKCSIYTVHLCCFPLLLCLFVHILCFPLYSCITFLFSVTFILSPLRKFSNSDFFVTICVNVIHWMSGCDQVIVSVIILFLYLHGRAMLIAFHTFMFLRDYERLIEP